MSQIHLPLEYRQMTKKRMTELKKKASVHDRQKLLVRKKSNEMTKKKTSNCVWAEEYAFFFFIKNSINIYPEKNSPPLKPMKHLPDL